MRNLVSAAVGLLLLVSSALALDNNNTAIVTVNEETIDISIIAS